MYWASAGQDVMHCTNETFVKRSSVEVQLETQVRKESEGSSSLRNGQFVAFASVSQTVFPLIRVEFLNIQELRQPWVWRSKKSPVGH